MISRLFTRKKLPTPEQKKLNKYLVVVDMQNDFCKPGGALYNPAAEAIIPGIKKRMQDFDGDHIIFTADKHAFDPMTPSLSTKTIEENSLPRHCIYQSTGAAIVEEFTMEADRGHVYQKSTFGYKFWEYSVLGNVVPVPEYIEICGTCTDICVISNALFLRSQFPYSRIVVNADLCAGTSKEAHEAALKVMESNLIEVYRPIYLQTSLTKQNQAN